MKTKYNLNCFYKGGLEHKYRAVVGYQTSDFQTVKVKDRSPNLYPKYYNETVGELVQNGDWFEFTSNGENIKIHHLTAHYLLMALMAEAKNYGYEFKVQKK